MKSNRRNLRRVLFCAVLSLFLLGPCCGSGSAAVYEDCVIGTGNRIIIDTNGNRQPDPGETAADDASFVVQYCT